MKLSYLHISFLLLVLVLPGCSLSEGPDNPEPIITTLEATDVTRTEAVISVQVDSRGGSELSYIRFHYGEGDIIDMQIDPDEKESNVATAHLKTLKPGTSYFYYAEAGTATAKISSSKLSFTTIPNERPTISGATALASGPVGICIGFEIIDDGGEELIELGCDVTNTLTNVTTRHKFQDGALTEKNYKMYIVGLTPLTSYAITPFCANSIGESKGESTVFVTENSISLYEPGTLSKIFDNHKIEQETMVISEKMNGDDFRFLRRALNAPMLIGDDEIESNVASVNLADVQIVEGGLSYDGGHFTVSDVISTGLFADCQSLESLVIPTSAKEIMKDAFSGCPRLKRITIPPNVSKLYPSSDCPSLEAIEVAEGNNSFCSSDGVLFNKDMSEIVWFPFGKEGEFSIPSTITSIGENAFIGTKISSLILPASVKTISRGAFAGSSLIEIRISDGIKNISEGLFQGCSSLRTVRLGKAVEFIGNYVFDGCGLEHIYLEAEIPPVLSAYSFKNSGYDLFNNCTLHVPATSLKVYKNHNGWSRFNNIAGF